MDYIKNYLKRFYTDPLFGKYYYGYKSDGSAYELSAVLENKNDKRCIIEGNFCIYRFKKGEIRENNRVVENTSLVELLPELGKYGFEAKETNEITQAEWVDSNKVIGKEYGISVSEKEIIENLNAPMSLVFGEYKRNNERLLIKIFKFESEKNAKKWFDSEVINLEELQYSLKNSVIVLDFRKIKVQGCESYYFTNGTEKKKIGYESSIFGLNGIYYFELTLWKDDPWPQDEAVQIAEEILIF